MKAATQPRQDTSATPAPKSAKHEAALDKALEGTFPASDPVALKAPHRGGVEPAPPGEKPESKGKPAKENAKGIPGLPSNVIDEKTLPPEKPV